MKSELTGNGHQIHGHLKQEITKCSANPDQGENYGRHERLRRLPPHGQENGTHKPTGSCSSGNQYLI